MSHCGQVPPWVEAIKNGASKRVKFSSIFLSILGQASIIHRSVLTSPLERYFNWCPSRPHRFLPDSLLIHEFTPVPKTSMESHGPGSANL